MTTSTSTSNAHPLYARNLLASRVLWEGVGSQPMPSAFVVGTNQTHTTTPQTTTLSPGADVVAVGASAQKGLAPIAPVLGFTGGQDVPYGETPSTPKLARAASIDDAVIILKMAGLTPLQEQQIRPDAAKLATWGIGQNTPVRVTELARLLLFTANTFRFGLVGTVIMPAMQDDPHGAFASSPFPATAGADALARVLDGFYTELATANEVACGHRGLLLSLADNVVMLVSGDTPKSSFQRNGWPDGTTGNANIMYVRSNGWLEPGWFGEIVADEDEFRSLHGLRLRHRDCRAVHECGARRGPLRRDAGQRAAGHRLEPAPLPGYRRADQALSELE